MTTVSANDDRYHNRDMLAPQPGQFLSSGTGNQAEAARSVLLAGVGGQGILLASNILARAALLARYDVKTNEVHGMAQRGGSVVAEIRFGKTVYSPLIAPGGADVLASLEEMEALRYARYLSPNGMAMVSTLRIIPTTVSSGLAKYPQNLPDKLRKAFRNLKRLDVAAAAEKVGNSKAGNLALLGAVSTALDFDQDLWRQAIGLCVKAKFVDMNLRAFRLGRELAA
ncbi:MAG: indolepyruvate oxidoreductase subunit beta [Planctomycetota bacterium]|jgi:indolepyruvate ferredoxin oxidoreductase beta subunit|nr:indolepyruvate oxidoreductase subunit beta [Planctomycetota bacterium]